MSSLIRIAVALTVIAVAVMGAALAIDASKEQNSKVCARNPELASCRYWRHP